MGIVHHEGVLRLAEGRGFPVGVDVIAFRKVLDDVLEDGRIAFFHHLVEPALGADLLVGHHEDLQFRIREHGGADIPAVHDDATALREGAEPLVHVVPHERNGRYRTHVGRDGKGADFRFDAALAEVEAGLSVVVAEMQVKVFHDSLQGLFVNGSVLGDHPVFHGEEGDAAVHRTAVQVQEIEFLRDHFGEGALAGGREAVNGDDDVGNVHNLSGISLTNVEKKVRIFA